MGFGVGIGVGFSPFTSTQRMLLARPALVEGARLNSWLFPHLLLSAISHRMPSRASYCIVLAKEECGMPPIYAVVPAHLPTWTANPPKGRFLSTLTVAAGRR